MFRVPNALITSYILSDGVTHALMQ